MRLRRVLWNPCKEYTRTGRPNTPSEGIRTTYPDRIYTRMCAAICTRLPLFAPGCASPFALGCRHCIRLLRTSTQMFTSRILTPDRKGERFNFSGRTYLDPLIAPTRRVSQIILYSVAVFSWSFLIFATDILRYFEIFCFRYLLSKSPNLLVTHQL